jgi:hypothetical protein
MFKIFIPVSKGRIKTHVRGYWHSAEQNKICYDYIEVLQVKTLTAQGLERLKEKYHQEALFYIDESGAGNIYYSMTNIEVLRHCKSFIISKRLKHSLKALIDTFGGVTVYDFKTYKLAIIFYK